MKKGIKLALCALSAAVIAGNVATFTACGGGETTINVSGSTSVNEIMTVLAGEYEKTHDVRININANGSGSGIEDTISGRNDFGMASRALEDSEKTKGIAEKQLCIDGIALVVGKDCGAEKVTNEQIYSLYIDGQSFEDNGASVLKAVGREASSGTCEAFNEKIRGGAENKTIKSSKVSYNTAVARPSSTGGVIDLIKSDKSNQTVGYISLGSYLKNTDALKALKFRAYGETDYVDATTANIKNESYKLQRPFMLITKTDGNMSDAAKDFYDWLWSGEAQAIISENGYVL